MTPPQGDRFLSATSVSARKEAMIGLITPILGRLVREHVFSLPGDLGDNSRVLIVDSGDLTELLFFAPVVNHLKSRFPGMRVTFLVREGNSELIRTMDQINEMISYEREHLSLFSTTYFTLLKRLKSREFNVVFLLEREFSFARSLLAVLSRAKLRVGFAQEFNYPFINCELRLTSNDQYESQRAIGFLNALGIRPDDSLTRWRLPDQDVRWANQMIHFRKPDPNEKLIVVDPGVGKGNHRLAERSFAQLVNQIAGRYPCKVLVVSNNLDQKGLDRFKSGLNVDLVDLVPKNVKEALALLSRADLLLSGNTDFFHFSVAMRLPSIGFFTRHDAPNWFPKNTPWVQIIQGVKGQKMSLEEVYSKIDTLLHLTGEEP
jgi:ADP-heptose:LPS heptosyltransferase